MEHGPQVGGFVHATAIVEDGAEIGPGTSVWHHAHVRAGAVIGAGCNLGKNVYVDAGVRLGSGVKIQNNVSIFAGVTIGDDVFLGPGVTFTNDRLPRASGEWQLIPTAVLRGASVGANCTLVCGVTVGEFAMVGAGSVVTKDVLDHELVVGNPARRLGWVCQCGRVLERSSSDRPRDLSCPSCHGLNA